MKMYDMLVMHNKNLGTRGDCMRACIATLLQEDPVSMPHFVDTLDHPNWILNLNRFLAERNLFYVQAPHQRMFWHSAAGDVYHLLVGKTVRETTHAVVALNGKIIHDPHPSRAGFKYPGDYNENLEAGFLARRK